MSAATVTSKGQVTIPSDIRAAFGIEPGHQIVFFRRLDGELGVRLRKMTPGSGYGLLNRYAEDVQSDAGGPYTPAGRQEVGEAVAAGVAERSHTVEGSNNKLNSRLTS